MGDFCKNSKFLLNNSPYNRDYGDLPGVVFSARLLRMRALIQRVKRAEVRIEGRVVARIGKGLLVLIGITADDTQEVAMTFAEKIIVLRVFDDDARRMNRSAQDVGGEFLVVSQFTLYADCRKGRRPSFERAAKASVAKDLYEAFVAALRARGVPVETGEFGAMMEVELVNDGPVTLFLDSADFISWEE